jgi:tetratricopeptide (TPR) repeat protein
MKKIGLKDKQPINPILVRKALRAWHSMPRLGKHPLAQLNIVEARRRAANYPDTLEDRGRALRDVLRDAINTFPHHTQSSGDEAGFEYLDKDWRPYMILTERFIQGRNHDYVAAQLGIARRTYFEEQSNALDTLADILRQREEALLGGRSPTPLPSSWQTTPDDAITKLETLPLDALPAPAPLPPGSLMPLGRNPLFVGREGDLKSLASALKGGETAVIGQLEIAAATGVGGIGKTQLASEFVHRYGQFFEGGVFWFSFADQKAIPAEVAACGGVGRLELRPNFGELSLEDQVRLVLAAWQEPIPRLLVFDNCEEPALLAQWRPASGGCRVLVTSRRADWEAGLGVRALPLDVLSRAESLALLRKHCPHADDETLDAIAEELGDLPLALHLAGSYMYRYRRVVTPSGYLAQLQSLALLEHASLKGLGFSPTGHVQNIYRTMALSYEKLDPANPIDRRALQILAHAACLAPGEPIPHHLLMLTLDLPEDDLAVALQAEDALNRLVELGLIRMETGNAARLHRLVVAFVRDIIADQVAAAHKAVESAVDREATRINQSGDPRPLLAWQPHLRAVTKAALERRDLQAAKLCNELGWHLWHIGDYEDGRPYFEQALRVRQKILGEDHPDTAHSYNSLGYLLRSQGKLGEAGPCFEQALAIREKVLGEEHRDTAISLNDMGRWVHWQGDLVTARQYYERALKVSRKVLGEDHPLTAEYLNNLATSLLDAGDLVGALPYLKQALAINEKSFGPEHPDTALNLNNIGYVLRLLGEPVQAQMYHERALAIRLKVLGMEHPDTAMSLRNLGIALQDQGHFDQAQSHLERALAIHEKAEGKEHPQTAICVTYLGLFFQARGDLNEAQKYLERALAIRQKVLRKDSPLQAISLTYLGRVLLSKGDLNRAQSCLEQALAIRQKVLGNEHLLTGQSLDILGSVLKAQGAMTRAQAYFRQALAIFETQLGSDHADTIRVRDNLSLTLSEISGTLAVFEPNQ